MGKIEFAECLRRFSRPEHLTKQFLFSASLVLAGIKPCALVTFQCACARDWSERRAWLVGEAGVSALELYRSRTSFTVLVYDRALLAAALGDPAAQRLLRRYAYPVGGGTAAQLAHLKGRFSGQAQTFPHEIGIFLGYPPADVSAFIETGGEAYLCCGYWKVYHDVAQAHDAFRRIDAVRMRAAKLIERGEPVCETARRIRAAGHCCPLG
jgi:hypothetical protein